MEYIMGYINKLDFERNSFLYIIRFIILIIFINTIYYIPFTESQRSTNNFEINKGHFYASFTTLIILLGVYILKFSSQKFKTVTIITSVILSFLIGIHFIAAQFGLYNAIYTGTTGYILLGIISIIPLIILFRALKRHLTNIEGWSGFIINFILYIPCLLDEFLEYFKKQFAITTNITFGLLGLEALLITAYVFLPNLISNAVKSSSIPLLEESYFLNESSYVLKHISDIYEKDDTKVDLLQAINTINDEPIEYSMGKSSYSITMWIYLNQQNSTTSTEDIFVYGRDNTNYFPKISYDGTTAGKNKLKFYFSKTAPCFDMLIESQKWNNIVFNYNNNRVDLFINGDLVKTYIFKAYDEPVRNYTQDLFKIGGDNLDGAICNIKYYKKPLTKYQITSFYNLLNGKNPPINNIM
jgi:hypothetical protein